MQTRHWFVLICALLLGLTPLTLTACSGDASHAYELAPQESLPTDMLSQPASVQEAYRFALGNPEILEQVPCYCGCGAIGHRSNYQCYFKGIGPDGTPQFDNHALGCSICVDITQDVMRLLDEGKSIPEIREYVDATYSKYGPSNIP